MQEALPSLCVVLDANDGRAKDLSTELAMSEQVERGERVVGGWVARTHPLRLPVLLVGILFAQGRRRVTTWLRAAGVSDEFQDDYYFLAALGRKTQSVAA